MMLWQKSHKYLKQAKVYLHNLFKLTLKGTISFLAGLFFISSTPVLLEAQKRTSLFLFEAQAVTAWNLTQNSVDFFSFNHHHPMQKPGLGLEALWRLRRGSVDFGYVSIQTRVVYQNEAEKPWAFQFYNAFINFKTKYSDFRLGHLRPALGLNYQLDNHSLLLPDATMFGFALDRDWGIALHRDWGWGDSALSLTTGSGMKFKLDGNFLLSTRFSWGVLDRDNYSLGMTGFVGRISEMFGMDETDTPEVPARWAGLALDASYFWLNFESRAEINIGRKEEKSAILLLYRQGLNILPEARLKLEAQASVYRNDLGWSHNLASGLTYRINPDLTFRSMVIYDSHQKITRLVFQFYYYRAF